MGGVHVACTDPGAKETRLSSPLNATIFPAETTDSDLLFTIVSLLVTLLVMSTLLFEFPFTSTVARTVTMPSNIRTDTIVMKHFAYWEETRAFFTAWGGLMIECVRSSVHVRKHTHHAPHPPEAHKWAD